MKHFARYLLVGLLFSYSLHAFNDGIISEAVIAKAEVKYGPFARKRFESYNALISSLANATEMEKIKEVNDFFNQVPYATDMQTWNRTDYWATPLEFLGRDRGDCEDYVIAKYFALKTLGVNPSKLYFTYVKSSRFKEPHLVLTYFKAPNYVPLVLDSLNYRIFPATERKDLSPIYNFNGDSLYLARKSGHGKQLKINEKTHKKWDDLLNNIKRNKL